MKRIKPDPSSMKIEHWQSQSGFPGEQLNYQNILAACLGGDGSQKRFQHCDTCKGDRELKWNPADPSHEIESRITYGLDGAVYADDDVFRHQLEDVLNLNLPEIKNRRKAMLNAVLHWWKVKKRELKAAPSRRHIEKRILRLLDGEGALEPYCQVAVWWLRLKLNRISS
jgi:hypothetical protein